MIFVEDIQKFDSFAIGYRIQEARIKKGMKAIDMAVLLEMSKDQYSRIECGTSLCKIPTLHKLAQYLEVSADYLLYGKTEDEYMNRIYTMIHRLPKKELEKVIQVIEILSA